jgi:quinol monooxygenase YgiN
MFVLIVRFRAAKGKERALEQLLEKARKQVYAEEENTLIYDLHRRIGDSTEILLYERYRDKKDWEITHMSKPYIKELIAELPGYVDGEVIHEEFDLVESP